MRLLVTCLTALLLALPAAAEKRIALTFDDVPRAPGAFMSVDERTVRLIAALDRAGVEQAAFFLTPGQLEAPWAGRGADRVKAYVAAGHVIANHSYAHPHLSDMTAEAFLADLDRAAAWMEARAGVRPWYRFPFLDEGREDAAKRAAVLDGLRARGLVNGHVTADGSDWNLENRTIEAVKAGQPLDMDALRALYVETMVGAANHADALAVKVLGRSPAHVLLLHETDLAALYIEDMVAALRADGWTIITADEAFADPITGTAPDVPSAQGTIIEMLAWEAGLPEPRWYERNDMRVANPLFDERVLGIERTAP